MIVPFWWISLLPWDESDYEFLTLFNLFLCHLLYLPLGVTFTIFFSLYNIIITPIAYIIHLLILIKTLSSQDETMNDFNEKWRRFKTIVKFAVIGPLLLCLGIPLDSFRFFKNLYTQPMIG